MRIKLNYIAPGLAAAAIGGAIALAPVASADTDPLVPYGTNPQVPYVLGFHESNHDEADTTNGQLDDDHNRVSAAASTPATAASCTAARIAAHGTVHGEPSAVTQ
jgi:hypothetical protein